MQIKVLVYQGARGCFILYEEPLSLRSAGLEVFFPGFAVSTSLVGCLLQTGHFSALLGLEKTQREFSTTFDAGNEQKPGTGKLLTGGTPELGDVWMS